MRLAEADNLITEPILAAVYHDGVVVVIIDNLRIAPSVSIGLLGHVRDKYMDS